MNRSTTHSVAHGWAASALALVLFAAAVPPSAAAEVGRIKVARGDASVERAGATIPARAGQRLLAADALRTGADGAIGVTMNDDALLSIGPNSVLRLDLFALDASSGQGRLATTLDRGTLAVVSGRIAKGAPDAMTVRTPRTVLGVRGTEFAVDVGAVAR